MVMSAQIIDGKALSQVVRDQIAKDAAALLARTGIKPGLAAILVGDDPASHLYVKNKQKACEAVGIYVADHKLPASTSQDDLLALIDKVNRDRSEEHTSELQSLAYLVCRLLLEKKKEMFTSRVTL